MSRVECDANLKQELDEALVQLNENVGLASQLSQAARLERRGAAAAAHSPGETAAAAEKATRAAVNRDRRVKGRLAGRRRGHICRGLATAGAARGRGVGDALSFGFHQLLNPSREVTEGVGDDGIRLHSQSLLVCAESQKRVDPLVPTSMHVWKAENVGSGIPSHSIAEEYGPASSSRACTLGSDKRRGAVGWR